MAETCEIKIGFSNFYSYDTIILTKAEQGRNFLGENSIVTEWAK